MVLAGKAQQEEIGDGANLTISFAGELLQNAEGLLGRAYIQVKSSGVIQKA